jgi:septum formation protein
MTKIILASQSPRRKELLTQMGVEFATVPSNFDEYLDDARSPEMVAVELAFGKAMTVARQHPDDIVIGSDTIVTVGGRQLAKAADDNEARQMLRLLSGTHNEVTTGLVVIRLSSNLELKGSDTATVYFRPYSEELVDQYIATGDYKDKAGAYGIQSGAAPLIEYFSGNYDTVLGLPTKLLSGFLSNLGVEAKSVELQAPVEQRTSSS